MDQDQFEHEWPKHEWTRWRYRAGNFASLKRVSPLIPCRHGVYIVRGPALLPRVRGSSDVVYIGNLVAANAVGNKGLALVTADPVACSTLEARTKSFARKWKPCLTDRNSYLNVHLSKRTIQNQSKHSSYMRTLRIIASCHRPTTINGLFPTHRDRMAPNQRLETDLRTRSLRSLASSAQP